jgi:hypothetical protein
MNILGVTISYAHIFYTVVLVVLGFLVSYYKANAKFRSFVATLINDAESLSKTGPEKKDWVVSQIYAILPAWLKPILTKTILSMIVQGTFDSMKQYATKLLDTTMNTVSAATATLQPIGTVSTDVAATASTGADQAAAVKQSTALSSGTQSDSVNAATAPVSAAPTSVQTESGAVAPVTTDAK